MIILPDDSQCRQCRKFIGMRQPNVVEAGEVFICHAFPQEIPRAVWTNEHDHREPFPGDNGVLFEPEDTEGLIL